MTEIKNSNLVRFLKNILSRIDLKLFNLLNIDDVKDLFHNFNNIIEKYINSKYESILEPNVANIKIPESIFNNIFSKNKNIFIENSEYYCNITFNRPIYNRSQFLHDYNFYKTDFKLNYYKYYDDTSYVNVVTGQIQTGISNNIYTEIKCNNEILNIKLNTQHDLNNLINYTFGQHKIKIINLMIKRSINSCGIILVHGINDMFNKNQTGYVLNLKLDNLYDIRILVNDLNIYLNLLDFLIRKSVKNLFERSSMVLFSTNIKNNIRINEINLLFDKFKEQGFIKDLTTFNNNSNNDIITLMIDHKIFINKYE